MFQPQRKLNEILHLTPAAPDYYDVTRALFGSIALSSADVRVLSGAHEELSGLPAHDDTATLLDIRVKPGKTFSARTGPDETAVLYLMEGEALAGDRRITRGSPVSIAGSSSYAVTASEKTPARLVCVSGPNISPPAAPLTQEHQLARAKGQR